MAAEIHVNDIGTEFEATVKDETNTIVNLALASLMQMKFKKPNGTVVTKTATWSSTGVDGRMKYVTVANDLDTAGAWQVQGYVESISGKWSTDVYRFRVYANVA